MQRPLGTITVPSPGTPVAVSTTSIHCQSILVQTLYTNTGRIYVFCYGQRVATLAIPTANTIPSFSVTIPDAPGGLDTAAYTIDAGVPGEGADVSYVRP